MAVSTVEGVATFRDAPREADATAVLVLECNGVLERSRWDELEVSVSLSEPLSEDVMLTVSLGVADIAPEYDVPKALPELWDGLVVDASLSETFHEGAALAVSLGVAEIVVEPLWERLVLVAALAVSLCVAEVVAETLWERVALAVSLSVSLGVAKMVSVRLGISLAVLLSLSEEV